MSKDRPLSERITAIETLLEGQKETLDEIKLKLTGSNSSPGWGVRLDRLEQLAKFVVWFLTPLWVGVVTVLIIDRLAGK